MIQKLLGTSWKTTLAGITQWLITLLTQARLMLDGVDTTNPDWNIVVASTVFMLGLLSARDNAVTSEDVKAAAK